MRRKARNAGQNSKRDTAPQKRERNSSQEDRLKKVKEHNKQQRRRSKRECLDAVLIKPEMGKTCVDMVSDITSKIKPDKTDTDIRSIRRTRGGDILMELGKLAKDAQALASDLKTALGEIGAIRSLLPRIALECMDLEKSSRRDLEENVGDFKVSISMENK